MTLHKNQKGFNKNLVCCSKLHHIIITTLIPSSKLSLRFLFSFFFVNFTEETHSLCKLSSELFVWNFNLSVTFESVSSLIFFPPVYVSHHLNSVSLSCASNVMTAGTSSLHLSFRDSVPLFCNHILRSQFTWNSPGSCFSSHRFSWYICCFRGCCSCSFFSFFFFFIFPVVLCLEFCLSFSFFSTVSSLWLSSNSTEKMNNTISFSPPLSFPSAEAGCCSI